MVMKFFIPALLALVPLGGQGAQQSAEFPIPQALLAEHKALHEVLGRAVKEPGALGAAARKLEQVLHAHFQREEEIALPPLALLPRLARGEITPDMANVLRMTDQLERQMPQLLAEHERVVAALQALRDAANAAGKQVYIEFVDALALHAQSEEQLTYPAALLVGRYVKLALQH